MEQITYKYNIRGWLTGINDMEHPGENRFVMQLDYNQAETPRYNGNIGSMSWQSAHFATSKQYHFSYDNANRLLTATYADAGKYTTHYTYDKNGNIKNLTRMGELGGSNTYGYIDQLTYAYTGNQLKYVNDNTGDNHQNNGFTDNGSLLTTNEYFYDLNGNLTRDLNKQINHIEYNYLNLPRRIDLSGANLNTINYLYSANGVKLQKNTTISHARSAPTDYLGTIVYPGEAPAYIFTPEGRALRNEQGNFDYEYFLKDHLGNTRVSVNQKGTILQDNSYYPFGISLGEALTYVDNTTNDNKYLYNGKEMQDDFGLEWYDYGARMYDGELGRWHVVDPMGEISRRWTPYQYTYNNPIRYIDPDGMVVDDYFSKEGKYLGKDNATTDNVQIIDQKSWDDNKTLSTIGNEEIDHEVGVKNSTNITKTALDDDAIVNVVEHYSEELDSESRVEDVDIESAHLSDEIVMESVTGGGSELFGIQIVSPANDILVNNGGNGTISPLLNTASNIKNTLVHEYKHQKDNGRYSNKALELRAISVQKSHSTYKNTTESYKENINWYESTFK